MLQALHRIEPEVFGQDLFLKFGSQDSFTIFSSIYAPVVELLKPGGAHLFLWMVGQVIWFAALVILAVTVFGRKRQALLAIIAAIVLSPTYGKGMLEYGEAFVTPRIFVEALSMISIALASRNSILPSYGMLLAAFLVHPLMALPGVVIVALLTLPIVKIVVPIALTGSLIVFGLAQAEVEPFTRVLTTYDDKWLAIVSERSRHAFVQDWIFLGALYASLPAVTLSFVAWKGRGFARSIAIATLVTGSLLLIMSWIGGDILSNVFLLNLQLWRSLWLVTLIGNLFAVYVVYLLKGDQRTRACLVVALVFNAIETLVVGIPLASTLVLFMAGISFWATSSLAGGLKRAAQLISTTGVAAATLLLFAEIFVQTGSKETAELLELLFRFSLIVGIFSLLISRAVIQNASPVTTIGISLVLLISSFTLADSRDERARYLASTHPPDADIRALLSGRTVYWEDGTDILWFKIRKPSFYSCTQGAGVMFYRDTALEFSRRGEILRNLNTSDFAVDDDENCLQRSIPIAEGPTSPDQIKAACSALSELDVMVLHASVPGVPHQSWRPPFSVPPSGFVVDEPASLRNRFNMHESDGLYHIYDCRGIRNL
ncbi:hypothetical protein [Marivita geojedonensis]|nr:hypothetical protein [Marivita geojedonensis]